MLTFLPCKQVDAGNNLSLAPFLSVIRMVGLGIPNPEERDRYLHGAPFIYESANGGRLGFHPSVSGFKSRLVYQLRRDTKAV